MRLLEKVQYQDQSIERLLRARANGRLAHGLIFQGPEGVGKKLTARAWAQELLCEQATPEGEKACACGTCRSCQWVVNGTHPDLHLVHKGLIKYTPEGRNRQALSLSIEVVRQFLIEPAGRAPTSGRCAVYIVEDAHELMPAAQNALLKTLEEPATDTYIILITARPQRLLETIRSRCQSVHFNRLPDAFIQEQLQQEKLSDAEGHFWAGFADGRLGVALSQAALGVYGFKQELLERLAQLRDETALETAGWLVEAAKAIAKQLSEKDETLSAASATRQAYALQLDLLEYITRLAVMALTGRLAEGTDQAASISQIAQRYGVLGLAQSTRWIQKTRDGLAGNGNPTLLLESLLLQYGKHEAVMATASY